jgi:type II secretory pathway pseudopilin PulG
MLRNFDRKFEPGVQRLQERVAKSEEGFSLIEVVIAFVIVLVSMLGVVQSFAYVTAYNAGNKTRSEALAIMQQEVELLRSKKFALAFTDPALAGGTRTNTVTTLSGHIFTVEDKIDNEPLVDGVQDDTYACLSPQGAVIPCTFKEITITVRLSAPGPGWQAAPPAKTVLRRTRGN